METTEAIKYYKSLPKEVQTLLFGIMGSTIDVCNELLQSVDKNATPIVFYEDVAYDSMMADVLAHYCNDEFYDVLNTKEWKVSEYHKNDSENSQLRILEKLAKNSRTLSKESPNS